MKTKLHVSSALRLLAFACGAVFLLGLVAPPARAQAPNWRKALQFDGVNDFVVFNGAPLLPPWTAEMWVCRQDAPYSSAVLLNDASTALKLEQTNQSRRVGFSTNGGDYVFDYIAPSNTWVHLAFVCDTSTRLYVNGVLQGTDPHTIPLPLQQLGALTNRLGQTNVALKAIVDDLRVWRVARSPAEIAGNLGHPLTGQESGLFSYWKFDETSGLRAWDATTNRLHGTLMNRPRHVPSRSTVEIALQGPACMTNGLHVPFVDPGAGNVATAFPLEVAGAWEQAYALQADSTVVHWGADTYSAIIPAAATNVVGLAVQSPAQFSFVVRDNATIIGWGPDWGVTNPPVRATNVVEVACGNSHALALRADGTVVGWGDNSKGQTNPPVRATNVVQIAAGLYHSLALRADGTIVGWGDNSKGATNAPTRATNVVQIATSFEHNVALRADGTVVAWGYNSDGQTNVPANVTNVVAVGAGYNFCMALKADGTLRVWGDTNIIYGTTNTYGLKNIPANATNVVAISAGTAQAWALTADGTLIGWGDTNYDALVIPSGLNSIRTNSVGVSGTLDVNTLGTYVLTYRTTNLFGQVGTTTRTVVVVPVVPLATTQPATAISATGATLHGAVNPQDSPTTAWFEYGLTTRYGSTTPGTNVGTGLIARDVGATLTGLLPWLTYHARTVASNMAGQVVGPDVTFTLAGPASTTPALSGLTGLTIPQGSSRVTTFSVSPGDLEVSVRCDNTVLFPAGSLSLGGRPTRAC